MKVLWQIPFKSLNGTTCRIDVYDPDVPESAPISPMTYQGAEDPFYFEEDDSRDLLNDVIRYKTGYIRMIDNGGQYVKDIYPESVFDRPVKVYYGGVVVFNGYIQVQDFSTENVPTPKIIELPVISALGTMSEITLNSYQAALYLPKQITLGALLDMMPGGFEGVYLPQIEHTELSQKVLSLAVSPWNKNFHHNFVGNPDFDNIYDPQTFAFVIEAICKAFGWICHETPTALVFSSFDYQDNYIYYPIGHIGDDNYKVTDQTPVDSVDIEDYYQNVDNRGLLSTIMPETGIKVEYEGDDNDEVFSFLRSRFNSIASPTDPADSELLSLCCLVPVNSLWEVQLATNVFTIDANDNISNGKGVVAWNGHEGILIAHDWNHNHGHTFFTLRHYCKRRPGQTWKVSYSIMGASNGKLYSMEGDDNLKSHFYTVITLADDYVEVTFNYSSTALASDYIVLFENIRFQVFENGDPYKEYRYAPTKDGDFIRQDASASVSASITMPLSLYRLNNNLIGDTVLTQKITEYPYLFQKRTELVQHFRLLERPNLMHTRLFNFQGKLWRIISEEFHPWDDECKLTLQHSPILADL